jgi:hypothetical protein
VLAKSKKKLLDTLGDTDKVLDIGGWADPFPRADWVLDMMPYETRGLYARRGWVERDDEASERFTESTWIQRDICDREPFPFDDDELDFVICAHTLEDIRDPIWVCNEMARVAKAGYIEVPSLLEELSYGFRGPMVGREHHRWLVEIAQEAAMVTFSFKDHALHHRHDSQFPPGFQEKLSEDERSQTLWWEGGFTATERHYVEVSASDSHLGDFVRAELARRGMPPPRPPGRLGRVRGLLRRRAPR